MQSKTAIPLFQSTRDAAPTSISSSHMWAAASGFVSARPRSLIGILRILLGPSGTSIMVASNRRKRPNLSALAHCDLVSSQPKPHMWKALMSGAPNSARGAPNTRSRISTSLSPRATYLCPRRVAQLHAKRMTVFRQGIALRSQSRLLHSPRLGVAIVHAHHLSLTTSCELTSPRYSPLRGWPSGKTHYFDGDHQLSIQDSHIPKSRRLLFGLRQGILPMAPPIDRPKPTLGGTIYPSSWTRSSGQHDNPNVVNAPTGSPGKASYTSEEGIVYLEGDELGRWLQNYLSEQIIRPRQGIMAVDPRLTPSWGGPSLGF